MKKSFLYAAAGMLLMASSCTKDFKEINTDPTRYSPDNFDANYFLSNAESNYAGVIGGYSGPILFQAGWAQIFAQATVTGDYYSNADKYVLSSNTNSYIENSWNNGYRAAALAQEIIKNRAADPESVNIVSAATIIKVLNMHYISDTYGDAPYTEALKAATEQITTPVYDKQQVAYNAMLTDLEAALNAMDASKAAPSADISSMAGSVATWKRFGYSLMLRMAMRLTKKDAAMAKTWAEKAAAGGTLQAGEDVYFRRQNSTGYGNNNVGAWLVATDFYQVRWSKTLIDYLKSVTDPRVTLVAEVPAAGFAANNDQSLAGDRTFAAQLGQPNGYDLNSGSATNIANAPGYPGPTGTGADVAAVGKYSRPNIDVYANRDLPLMVLTYAESELLLAEAALRGFNVGGTAAVHYANGVAGGLTALNKFKEGTISEGAATTYAATHPLVTLSTEAALEQINTQYWATTGVLWNFAEAWSNWRRSGYPVLTPVNYTGNFSGGAIPRRQPYPVAELARNPTNYQAGVTGLSAGDTWNSRVWWDQ